MNMESREYFGIIRFAKLLLLMLIPTVMTYSIFQLDYPIVWWPIECYFLYLAYKYQGINTSAKTINCFLLWVFISFLYGVFMSHSYWHWKLLINNIILYSLPIMAYLFADPEKNMTILNYWYSKAPLFIICLIPFAGMSHYYGRLMQPFTLMLLFLPLLTRRYRNFAFIALGISIVFGFSDRSDNIRLIFCTILGILSIGNFKYITDRYVGKMAIGLLFAPFMFFALAITGIFNILDIGREMGWEHEITTAAGAQKDIFSDTRTGLYIEAIESSIKNDYYIFGRSLARGYDTSLFSAKISKSLGFEYNERGASETGILNIYTYLGIIGVFLFFMIFFRAVTKAVFHSNNRYIPIIGFFVAFRWAYSWVEEYQRFDLSYIFMWIMVGMCLSTEFREMDDEDFENYFYGLQLK